MAGVQLRTMGTTATRAPIVKRSIATLSDGRVVSLVIDRNDNSTFGAGDLTNVAKMYFYVSNDTSRTAMTMALAYTPVVEIANDTRSACASMTVDSANNIFVAWQGAADASLHVTRFTYTAGAVAFAADQVVQAAGAITNRFRSIDIDIAGTVPAVMTYEASTSDGNGSTHRVYVRLTDGVTWRRAVNLTAVPGGSFIKSFSEDVSIAWRGDGIVANVGRFLIYGTKTRTTGDIGDVIREYSFNVLSGAADSGTLLGGWSTTWHVNQAAGTRRSMIFSISPTVYLIGGVVGNGVPQFWASKLTSGNYGTPMVNRQGYVAKVALSNFFQIDSTYNQRTSFSASYKDNRLIFGFAAPGQNNAPRIAREVVFTWPDLASVGAKASLDAIPRPLDSSHYGDGGPIGVYGGDNRRVQAGLKYYNFLVMYGQPGDGWPTAGPAFDAYFERTMRFVAEDTFDAPALLTPYQVEPTDSPVYRVRVENTNLQPNLYGKIEVQVASNNLYTTNLRTIIEPDANYRYFGSKDGLTGIVNQVAVKTLLSSQRLFTGDWYWRARIVSDKDTPGAWSGSGSFEVSHPPIATPLFPKKDSLVEKSGTDSYLFAWKVSDTEPTDMQTAYRVVVRRLDTGVSIHDTGWITSGSSAPTLTIDVDELGLLETPLGWTVQLKDKDGATGPTSAEQTFHVGTAPTVAITDPVTGSTVTTALPTVSWTFTPSGGRTQKAYRIWIVDNDTVDGEIIADTQWRTGTETTYIFNTQVLQNDGDYTIYLDVKDSDGLQGATFSEITTDWIEPALAVATVTTDNFKHTIEWTDAQQDSDFVGWRVYRRYMKPAHVSLDTDLTSVVWYLVHETNDVLTDYVFEDYTAPLNKSVDYVVVQVADRFGSLIESNITAFYTVQHTADRYYFVPTVPVGTIMSFEAANVTGDQFTREIEQESLHVVGRGRQVQIGDDLGYAGSLTIKMRTPDTARLNREFLERLSSENNKVYIKSPFGDVVLAALGNIQTTRQAGYGGNADIADLVVPYMEIIDEDPTIRMA